MSSCAKHWERDCPLVTVSDQCPTVVSPGFVDRGRRKYSGPMPGNKPETVERKGTGFGVGIWRRRRFPSRPDLFPQSDLLDSQQLRSGNPPLALALPVT